jgi:hypothetical protein
VHADDALGPRSGGRDLGHRQRGRVRGQDRVAREDAFELREDLLLHVQLLDDGFDHEVAVGQVVELRRQREPLQRGIALLGRHPALFDTAVEVALDRRARPGAQLVGDVAPDRLQPRLDDDLRDARAHRPQPDHTYLANLGHRRAMLSAWAMRPSTSSASSSRAPGSSPLGRVNACARPTPI